MQPLPHTMPESRVGIWCHWGAWIVLIIGALQVLILIVQNNPILPILGVISGTIFSFLILYAVGTVVTALVGQRAHPPAAAGASPATPQATPAGTAAPDQRQHA